jgi:hypothetical protein
MERELVRTCSTEQAACMAAAAGRCVRAAGSLVRILVPTGRFPIDPDSGSRYIARIEFVDGNPSGGWAGPAAATVVEELFGAYLDEPAGDTPVAGIPRDRAAIAV